MDAYSIGLYAHNKVKALALTLSLCKQNTVIIYFLLWSTVAEEGNIWEFLLISPWLWNWLFSPLLPSHRVNITQNGWECTEYILFSRKGLFPQVSSRYFWGLKTESRNHSSLLTYWDKLWFDRSHFIIIIISNSEQTAYDPNINGSVEMNLESRF